MNSKEVTALALRFFAIYILVYMFVNVGSFVGTFWETVFVRKGEPSSLFRVYAVSTFATAVIGSVLAYSLFKLSNSVLNKVPDSGPELDNGLEKSFFISLLGLYFIVTALGQLPYWFAFDPGKDTRIAQALFFLRHSFTLLAGVILVAMPHRISKLLSKAGA